MELRARSGGGRGWQGCADWAAYALCVVHMRAIDFLLDNMGVFRKRCFTDKFWSRAQRDTQCRPDYRVEMDVRGTGSSDE